MEHTKTHIQEADEIARQTGDPAKTLARLRQLGLDDFGMLMISLPDKAYPNLSAILPAMASEQIQKTWTGNQGIDLLKQTLAFVRLVEANFVRYAHEPLQGKTILDFGCGYSRILRMMYYYSDPQQIWGVDAWEKSLATSREARVLGNLVKSERVPEKLPVGETKFDFAFAFSVFTHLAPKAADACLAAIRKHMRDKAIFIATFRPVEFWPFIDGIRNTNFSKDMVAAHNTSGIGYNPHQGPEGETYGDTSLTSAFFAKPGWEVLGCDRSLQDPYQLSVILRAV